MSSEILIDLCNLRFNYHNRPEVLKGLNLKVTSDHRLGLVGANGTGKTTVLSIIMGLLKPTSGTVEIFGKLRKTEADFREVRPKLGFVFQDANDQLFSPTVADDIAFGPLNLGASRKQADDIVKEVLDSLGLSGFGPRVTYGLSGGERKLVALGTALALKPRLLILDEPTTFLDEKSVARLEAIINNSTLPVLIVSHDHDFLDRVTTKKVRLLDGIIEGQQ
ncbi:MAG: energy-coupling factor ABC transporter ATP-binding protein [Deltaproteobacteria bacterium]|jgi:cobalt/nickel transport system ATP-binding protein|nr:energy-coupling factor ABC transporter ATP-binding protein [Deltaproteobacteria bacterium]